MFRGWMINLVLLVVLLAGGAVLWALDRQESREKVAGEASRAIGAIKSDQVVSLTFRDAGGVEIALRKTDGRWSVVKGDKKLDAMAIDRLLTVLDVRFDRQVRMALNKEEAAVFGLDAPKAVLTVTDVGGNDETVWLGEKAPASRNHYLRLGENGPVVLVAGDRLSGLMQSVVDLRDKRLLPFRMAADLKRVVIQRRSGHLELSREGADPWRLRSPIIDEGDGERISSWLNGLLNGHGNDFEERAVPGEPDWMVTLTPEEGAVFTLPLWRWQGRVLARRPGEADALVMPAHLADTLDKPALELLSHKPLGRRSAPERITLRQGQREVTAEKKEKKWPLPAWNDLEEILTRSAWRCTIPGAPTSPWLTMRGGSGDDAWEVVLRKRGDHLYLAPSDRPVELELTRLQSESAETSLRVIMNREAADSGNPG